MDTIIEYGGISLLSIITIFLFIAAITSKKEKENRATKILFVSFVILLSLNLIYYILPNNLKIIASIIIFSITLLALILIFFPNSKKEKRGYQKPKQQIDERLIMFSRNELKEGTERFDDFYKLYPSLLDGDNKFRKNAGLLSVQSKFYEPISYGMANATFFTVEQFKSSVNFPEKEMKNNIDSEKISQFIKTWAKKLGAHSAGICKLQNYHLYSVHGRGDIYGKTVENKHKFAFAFTVEMDKEHIDAAPQGATVVESAQQYLHAGNIAMQIAAFINSLGHGARAHIDGDYEVVCPLVAKDAGLGEIGRMGILITPQLGPRVRIGVITTDIPLITDDSNFASDVTDFCVQCKKCAVACPAQAISFNNREEIKGVLRWQINQEACFNYWTISGTDCARCISVCPYSHENNWLHNMVRTGLKTSSGFRKTAVLLDDLLYGKKPKPKATPDYIQL